MLVRKVATTRIIVAVLLPILFSAPVRAAVNILMVTTNNGTLTAMESGRKSMLESYGYTVNTIWDGAAQATFNAAFASNHVIYLPDEATEADVGYKLRAATIGIVSEHPGLADQLGFCSSAASTVASSTINITNNTHYATGVFALGNLTLGSGTYQVTQLGGTVASGGTQLATVTGATSIVAVETGAALANTYGSNSTAAGRRVQFPLPISVNDGSTFNTNPYTLASRMLWWAAGLDRALIVRWKLDETSGTVATDASGFATHGTYTGATLGAVAPWRLGAYVAANGQYITAPASMPMNSIGVTNTDFSVAFWLKPNGQNGGWRTLLHKGNGEFVRGPGIWLNPGNNRVHFRVSTTANNNEGTDSSGSLPDNAWSHIACVKSGNKWRCYINGVLDTEFTLAGTTTGNAGPLYVGDNPWHEVAKAYFDDVRIYTFALTDAEIKKLHGSVARWKLDESSGTVAADASIAANPGTYTSGPILNQAGIRDAAVYFDGMDDYVAVPDSTSLRATEGVTIAAWIRPVASSNIDRMIVNKEGEYELAISSTNEIKWAFANTSPGWNWHSTGKYVANDAWSHIVVSYDGVEVKTFLNGALVETFAASGNIGDAHLTLNELRIGGRANSPAGKFFAGHIDDVYVLTRPVTDEEVVKMHGLLGHWKFAEGTGVSAADSSLLGNTATLSGGASWTSDCAGNNNALLTNGTGGIAQTAAAFTPPDTGTVTFWMRSTGQPASVRRILGLGGDWEIRQNPDGRVISDLCGDGATSIGTVTALTVVDRWYHFAATFDSANDTYAIYVDGKLELSGTNSVAMNQQAAALLSFGTRTGTAEYWSGALRDVRLYNRKLSATEIAEMFGLIGHWKLDETSGIWAADSSGFGRTLTIFGTADWSQSGASDGSLKLNGATRADVVSLLNAPPNVTVSAWAFLTAADNSGAEIVSLGDYFGMRLNEGSSSRAFFYDGFTWVSAAVNQTFANTGWHHFAAVFNDTSNTCKFYVDAIEVASVSTTASIPYAGLGNKTVIGADGNSGANRDFTGWIDDVRVYSRALCPGEITRLKEDGNPFEGVKIISWVEIQ